MNVLLKGRGPWCGNRGLANRAVWTRNRQLAQRWEIRLNALSSGGTELTFSQMQTCTSKNTNTQTNVNAVVSLNHWQAALTFLLHFFCFSLCRRHQGYKRKQMELGLNKRIEWDRLTERLIRRTKGRRHAHSPLNVYTGLPVFVLRFFEKAWSNLYPV